MADIEQLSIQIEATSTDATTKLEALATALEGLKAKTQGVSLGHLPSSLKKISESLQGMGTGDGAKLKSLADGLTAIGAVQNVKISSSIANQLDKIAPAVSALSQVDFGSLDRLAYGMEAIGSTKVTGLATFATNIGKVQVALENLAHSNASTVLSDLARAMTSLSAPMESVKASSTGLGKNLDKLAISTSSVHAANEKTTASYMKLGLGIGAAYASVSRIISGLTTVINASNKYVEDLNLFTVALGEYAGEAEKYAETVSELMGIDPGSWMRDQGVFNTLLSGFGAASDRAYTMSQNLTQLGYDISSFYNMSVETAMQKLQSGISGELEPLRRLGYDLSVARLQQEAYNLGINESVSAMTQAEKAELRYYAIMTQVTAAQGDMARTLETPANQLRVFQAQIQQAARAIGNIFIPALNAILPVAIAVTKVIRLMANTLAQLFGFSLPEIDYSGVEVAAGATEDIADNVGSAAGSAQKLRKFLLGIDELNILPEASSSGGGGGASASDIGSGLNFELPTYDFLGGLVESRVEGLVNTMKEWLGITEDINSWTDLLHTNLGKVLTTVGLIGTGILAWNISQDVQKAIAFFQGLNTAGKMTIGMTLAVTGIALSAESGYSMGYNGFNWTDLITGILGAGLAGVGGVIAFGTVGWVLTIPAVLAFAISAEIGYNQRQLEEDMKARFGELHLTSEEITKLAQDTIGDVQAEIDVLVTANAKVTNLEESIRTQLQSIGETTEKINLGIELDSDDISGYQSTIESYVANVNEYIHQRGYAIELGLNLAYGSDASKQGAIDSNSAITSLLERELGDLTSQLREMSGKLFEGGVLHLDVQTEVQNILGEISQITSIVSESESQAKLATINLKYQIGAMDESSFEAYKAELSEMAETMRESAEQAIESTMQGLIANVSIAEAHLQSDPNNTEWQDALAEAQRALDEYTTANPLQARFDEINMIINEHVFSKLQNMFADELSQVFTLSTSQFGKTYELDLFSGLTADDIMDSLGLQTVISELTNGLARSIATEVSPTARENIHKMMGDILPTIEDMQGELAKAVSLGKAFPEAYEQSMVDAFTLMASSSDIEESVQGIYFLIGHSLSESEAFYNALSTADMTGQLIDQNVINGINSNLTFVENAATGMIDIVKDGVVTASIEATPTLKKNLEALGVTVGNGLISGVTSTESSVESTTTRLGGVAVGGVGTGILGASPALNYRVQALSTDISKWLNTADGGLENRFETSGATAVSGLNSGISSNYSTTRKPIETWAGETRRWFSGVANRGVYSALGSELTGGLSSGISTSYGNSKSSVNTWSKYIKSTFTGDVSKSTFEGYAKDMISGFSDAIFGSYKTIEGNMKTFAKYTYTTFNSAVNSDTFYGMGRNVVSGFNNGISYAASSSQYYINRWASNISRWFKNVLGIHSPSRVFGEMAEFTIEGYNEGIEKYGEGTKRVMEDWTNSIVALSPVLAFAVDTSAMDKAVDSYNSGSINARVRTSANISAEGLAQEMTDTMAESDATQNELLRTQNELLREILGKTGVNLDGRKLTNAVNKYQENMARARG